MKEPESPQVKEYFDKIAEEFDSIYSGQKNALLRFLDRVLRKDMYDRLRLTLEECGSPDIRSVLDVGTGSGRFCLPLAGNKDRVIGIDFSPSMIELARQHARELGVAERCEFRVGDFLAMEFEGPVDAVMAIGLFDYIAQPAVFLRKMKSLTRKKIVVTFPSSRTWRAIPRWIRLRLQGCPVYFYNPKKVQNLFREAGLEIRKLKRVGKIYLVVAVPEKTNS